MVIYGLETKTLGDELRQARHRCGLTQSEVAALVGELVPLTRSHYSNLERDAHVPTVLVTEVLASVLGLDVDHLKTLRAEAKSRRRASDATACSTGWPATAEDATDVVQNVGAGDGAYFVAPEEPMEGAGTVVYRGAEEIATRLWEAISWYKQSSLGAPPRPSILLLGFLDGGLVSNRAAGLPLRVRGALASAMEAGLTVSWICPHGGTPSDDAAVARAISPLIACRHFEAHSIGETQIESRIVLGNSRSIRVFTNSSAAAFAVEYSKPAEVLADRAELLGLVSATRPPNAVRGPGPEPSEIPIRRFAWDDHCGTELAERARFQTELAEITADAAQRGLPLRLLSSSPPQLMMSEPTFSLYLDGLRRCDENQNLEALEEYALSHRLRRLAFEQLLADGGSVRILLSSDSLEAYARQGTAPFFAHDGCQAMERMRIARAHLDDILELVTAYSNLSIAVARNAPFGRALKFEIYGDEATSRSVAVTSRYHSVSIGESSLEKPMGLIVGRQLVSPFLACFEEVWRAAEDDRPTITTRLFGYSMKAAATA